MKTLALVHLGLLIFFCPLPSNAGARRLSAAKLERIDVHAHVFQVPPVLSELLKRLDIRLLNICVVDKHDRGYEDAESQNKIARKIYQDSKHRIAWASTFDPQDWESATFSQTVASELDRTFAEGALGVKIYKSIGMELKSQSGRYLMPDDPAFHPILELLARRGKTLLTHLAEPIAAWLPLDPSSPHYQYYKNNPVWHVYLNPDRPSKDSILAARDRLLEHHPTLRVIGVHLGSMEEDVDAIAKRLDRYRNFAVDTGARIPDLMIQPREKVRAFMIQYQDRVLYGTDLSMMPWEDPNDKTQRWEETYSRDWKFFASDETFDYKGRQVQGLDLPEAVLKKLYRTNALTWLPGIGN